MSNDSPASLSISDYGYELPDHRIAKYPLETRDQSKLLVYKSSEISQKTFTDLPDLLRPNDCLVFNDTKVIHARLQFQRATGAQIEILCLEPVEPVEITEAFSTTGSTVWKAMVGNAKRWKHGEKLSREILTDTGSFLLNVERIGRDADAFHVRFFWESKSTFSEVLDSIGILPLPPYLNRNTEEEDLRRYQTVYAQADGSVAAPTAGLHFTKRVFDELQEKGVQSNFVTLHVGAGTFKPVKSETMEGHEMHKERISISINAIEKMHQVATSGNRIIVVGTTSLRTVESIYWFGIKLLAGIDMRELFVGQWEPYELVNKKVSVKESLQAVLNWMKANNNSYLNGSTQLLIAPGYNISMADALITNFHQPQSTLLLLVAALVGPKWKSIYDYALDNDFRFLSYGDSSILFRNTSN